MERLFVERYLDEDVDVLVAELLHAYGFVAVTARDAGLLKLSDADPLTYAVNQGKALLTHNRADFEKLALEYFASEQTHYGIILAVRRSAYEIVRRLLRLLDQVTAGEMMNQLIYI